MCLRCAAMDRPTSTPTTLRVGGRAAGRRGRGVRRATPAGSEVFGRGCRRRCGAVRSQSRAPPTDPVTVVDTETERLLRDRLAELRPGDASSARRTAVRRRPTPGSSTWVLDPIDGTVNFLYGIAAYAVSVGVQIDGVSVAGAVADVGDRRRVFGGTWVTAPGVHARRCRQRRSAVQRRHRAVDGAGGTGSAISPSRRRRQAAVLAALLPEVRDMRRIGSCALDLCMVAAGRLDAYYEHGLHVWDWAAGCADRRRGGRAGAVADLHG